MSTFIPTSQIRVNDPYQQRIFDFNTDDSKLYLTRTSNQLLRVFENDIILSGLNITNISFNGTVITVELSNGLAIIDRTVVEINDSNIELDLDVAGYDDNGCLLLVLNYGFLQTVQSNPVRIRFVYLDQSHSTVLPDGWNPIRDRIVLGVVNFVKNPSVISEVSISELTKIDIWISPTERNWYYIGGYTNDFPINLRTYVERLFDLYGGGSGSLQIEAVQDLSYVNLQTLDGQNLVNTYKYEYKNLSKMNEASGFSDEDIGLFAKNLEDGSIWILDRALPSVRWLQISN